MFARLGSWCFHHRKRVVVLWVVALCILGGASGAVGTDFREDFTGPDVESQTGFDILNEHFGGQGAGLTGTIVFRADQGVDDPEVRSAMEGFLAELAAHDDLTVEGPYDEGGEFRTAGGVEVSMGPILDGYSEHMDDHPDHLSFVKSEAAQPDQAGVVRILKESGAEVLLNYAEAKAELGTITDEDWAQTIGVLRQRGGITGGLASLPTEVDTYLQENYFPEVSNPVLLEIRRERGVELVMEGFRFYDLVRWKRGDLMEKTFNGIYVPALNQPMDLNDDGRLDVAFYQSTPPDVTVPGVEYVSVGERGGSNPRILSNGDHGELLWFWNHPRVWEEKHYLYPVPEQDRLFNPALGQNPGWD